MPEPRTNRAGKVPKAGAYARMREISPEVVRAYEELSGAAGAAGDLDQCTVALVKLAMSVGRGNWRGVHAHARKALEAGVTPAAVRQVAAVAVPTLGLHAALDALRWIDEVVAERE